MKTTLPLLALVSCIPLLPLRAAVPEPPVGTFTFTLGNGEGTSIWDVTGDYVITQQVAGLDFTLTFHLTQDIRGELVADGQAVIAGPETVLAGPLTLNGRIRSKADTSEVLLNGKATADEESEPFTAKIQLKMGVHEPSHELRGKLKGSLQIPAQKRIRLNVPATAPLPPSASGEWNITVEIEKAGREYDPDEEYGEEYEGRGIMLRGTANATLGSGLTLNLRGPGVYSRYGLLRIDYDSDLYYADSIHEIVGPRESKLHLYGVDTAGASLMLHGYRETFDLLRVRGRIAGQRALWP